MSSTPPPSPTHPRPERRPVCAPTPSQPQVGAELGGGRDAPEKVPCRGSRRARTPPPPLSGSGAWSAGRCAAAGFENASDKWPGTSGKLRPPGASEGSGQPRDPRASCAPSGQKLPLCHPTADFALLLLLTLQSPRPGQEDGSQGPSGESVGLPSVAFVCPPWAPPEGWLYQRPLFPRKGIPENTPGKRERGPGRGKSGRVSEKQPPPSRN